MNTTSSTTETNDTTITKIVFDYWSATYKTLLGNFTTGTDVSYSNDGSIRLFYDNTNNIVYVLSPYRIKILNCSYLCQNLLALEEINFNNFDTSENTSFERLFLSCSSLERQTGMENFDTSECTTMENMLRHIKLDKIGQDNTCDLNVSGWDTRKVTNMRQMFRNNQASYIDISNFLTPVCNSFPTMFANCSNLVTLNMENIDMSLCDGTTTGTPQHNASDFLQDCSNLTNLTFCKNLGVGYTQSASAYQASINLSKSPLLTHDSIMSVFNNIGRVSAGMFQPYIYMGSTNYSKVTIGERGLAEGKAWLVTSNSR